MAHRSTSPFDVKIIWKKIYASITSEEEAQLQQWLAEKEAHRRYYETICRFYRHSPHDEVPIRTPEAWQDIQSRLSLRERPRRYQKRWRMAAAITSLVGLLTAWLYWISTPLPTNLSTDRSPIPSDQVVLQIEGEDNYTLSAQAVDTVVAGTLIHGQATLLAYQPTAEPTTIVQYHTLRVPRGSQYLLTLTDSTQVWLNAETTLRYPVPFSGDERNVTLSGEAYFEVAHNPAKPFRVTSGKQVVTVTGTAFNVTAYPEDSVTYTTLAEGAVNVSLIGVSTTFQELKPNQRSVWTRGTDTLCQQTVEAAEYIAWKENRFVFRNQSLQEIMNTLSRWYDVEIVFANQAAAHQHFTGEMQRYENLGTILMLIEKTNQVSFTKKGKQIIVH